MLTWRDAVNTVKLLAAALCMAFLVYGVTTIVPQGDSLIEKTLSLALPALGGIVVYVLLLFCFKTEEAGSIRTMLKQKTKKVN